MKTSVRPSLWAFFLGPARSCAANCGSPLRCARAPCRPGVAGSSRAPAGSSRRGLRGRRRRTRLRSAERLADKSTAVWGSRAPRGLPATAPSSVPSARRLTAACARRARLGANQRLPAGDIQPPNGSHFAVPLSPAAPPRTDSSLPPRPAARPPAAASPKPQNLVVLLSDSPCLLRRDKVPKGYLILCEFNKTAVPTSLAPPLGQRQGGWMVPSEGRKPWRYARAPVR